MTKVVLFLAITIPVSSCSAIDVFLLLMQRYLLSIKMGHIDNLSSKNKLLKNLKLIILNYSSLHFIIKIIYICTVFTLFLHLSILSNASHIPPPSQIQGLFLYYCYTHIHKSICTYILLSLFIIDHLYMILG